MKDRIAEILRGSFDLHVHAGPDPGQERRVDALDAGRYAHEAEMAGFALKSHHYPTAPLAQALNRVYPGLNVVGAIALNVQVGGLNPEAVEASAAMGAGVVWMPTYDADFFMRRQGLGPGIRVLDETGRLKPEVYDIIEVVRRNDMVLASGHLAPEETIALFAAASACRGRAHAGHAPRAHCQPGRDGTHDRRGRLRRADDVDVHALVQSHDPGRDRRDGQEPLGRSAAS